MRDFKDLHQTIETMAKITAKFRERVLLISQYTKDEMMKKTRYHDMMRDDIREFVSISGCKPLEDIIARAWEQDIELQFGLKHRSE